MLYMGKDKALSVDGISDIIFKRTTWRKIGQEDCLLMDPRHEFTTLEN